MSTRTMMLLAILPACTQTPVSIEARQRTAQTAALTGEPGERGATGATGVMVGAGGWVGVTNDVVSLAAPAACSDGSLLKHTAGSLACAADEKGAIAGVATLEAGLGVLVSSTSGNLIMSARTGTSSQDCAPGLHGHAGAVWRGSSIGRGFSVINQLEDDPAFPATPANPSQGGIYAEMSSGTPGTDFTVAPTVYHAAIIARNTAPGGVGLIGESRMGGGVGSTRMGVAGYASAVGVFGKGSSGAMGVHAFADQTGTVALNATNRDVSGPRVAIQTLGTTDLSDATLKGALTVYESVGSNWADCGEPTKEIAISGSCDTTGGLFVRCLVGPSGLCLSNGPTISQAPTRFYCAAGGSVVRARVVCLKTAI